jgi:hypothetical protein
MTKKQEIATVDAALAVTNNLPALSAEMMGSWDDASDLEAKDIRIPRLLLMQSTSELVGQRKAQAGDIVNSITGEKIGDEATPLQVVPLHTYKTWIVSEKVNGKYEYKRQDPYTPGVERPREEKIGELEVQNVESINVLVMLANEQSNLEAMPYLLAFRMTSLSAGKDVLTQKRMSLNANISFQRYLLEIAPVYTKNDKGQFFVFKYKGKKENKEFVNSASILRKWFETFKAGAAQIHEETTEVTAETAPLNTQTEGDRF